MTGYPGRMSDPYGERPLPDVLDQLREELPPDEPYLDPPDEMPLDADEADAIDQRRIVPLTDDDEGEPGP